MSLKRSFPETLRYLWFLEAVCQGFLGQVENDVTLFCYNIIDKAVPV